MSNVIATTVRYLQVGDVLTGSGQEVLALGPVQGRERAVRVRRTNGSERVASWRPDTRVRVERAGS